MRLSKHGIPAIFIAVLAMAAAQAAPGPLAALAVGSGVTYNVVTAQQNGAQQAMHSVHIARGAPAIFKVSIDGGPPAVAAPNPDGSISTTPQVKSALAPLLQISAMMRGSPARLTQTSMWNSMLPVPIKDATVQVPLSVHVVDAGKNGESISASGSAQTSVKHGIRSFPATVSVQCTFRRNSRGIVTNANGSVSVDVERAMGGKTVNNTFTLTKTGE